MRRLNMHSGGFDVFLLSFERGKMRFFIVPNVFLMLFPIAAHHYPICFGQSWTFKPLGLYCTQQSISISRFIHARYMH